MDDQLTFNQIVAGSPTKGKGEPIYPLRAAGDGGRVVFDGTPSALDEPALRLIYPGLEPGLHGLAA